MAVWAPTARRAGVDLAELHATLLAFCAEPRTVAEMEAQPRRAGAGRRVGRHLAERRPPRGVPAREHGGGLVHVPPSGFWGQHGKPRYVAAAAWIGEARRADRPGRRRARRRSSATSARTGRRRCADIGKWLGPPRVGPLRDDGRSASGDRLRTAAGRRRPRAAGPRRRHAAGRGSGRAAALPVALGQRPHLVRRAGRGSCRPPIAPPWPRRTGTSCRPSSSTGSWPGCGRSTTTKGVATLRLEPFGRVGAADRRALEAEGERLVRFMRARRPGSRADLGLTAGSWDGLAGLGVPPLDRAGVAVLQRLARAVGQVEDPAATRTDRGRRPASVTVLPS